MTIPGRNVLFVGLNSDTAQDLTDRLRCLGFRCFSATNLAAARELFELIRIDLVLTNTQLSDGTGLGLAASLAGFSVTVFLRVPDDESCMWLPAIDCGDVCLGAADLGPVEFLTMLEEMAGHLFHEPQVFHEPQAH